MVMRLAVFLILGTASFVPLARGDAVSTAIAAFGLTGNWADQCEDGSARQSFRLVVETPSAGPAAYKSVNIDNGVKTTIRSVVVAADPMPPKKLKLRMRIVGGDVDGGPLPSPTTSTFEQTFEKSADGGLTMLGNPPIPLKRCGL